MILPRSVAHAPSILAGSLYLLADFYRFMNLGRNAFRSSLSLYSQTSLLGIREAPFVRAKLDLVLVEKRTCNELKNRIRRNSLSPHLPCVQPKCQFSQGLFSEDMWKYLKSSKPCPTHPTGRNEPFRFLFFARLPWFSQLNERQDPAHFR